MGGLASVLTIGCHPRLRKTFSTARISRVRCRSMDHGLELAIARAGSARKLARMLGISMQAVIKWKTVPAHQIVPIEKATGVPREELRPDLYRRS